MKAIPQDCIRNFSIIAHIDHGKSTLADRLIQLCGGLSEREMANQVLDSMDLERERGITIKAQCVSLRYTAQDGNEYLFNIIDTPGHVDFSYEVSRSLYACEGALLVVDAAQGVEAQTVANAYTAVEQGLEVLPVLNKVDLPQAEPERVVTEIEDIVGIEARDAPRVSAKMATGIVELAEYIVERIPAPSGDAQSALQVLIVDSWYDSYLGVVTLVRVIAGVLESGDKLLFKSNKHEHLAEQIGVFTPKKLPVNSLRAGEVGYLIASIKEVDGAPVGDTITHAYSPSTVALPGFKKVSPQVYAGIFPISADSYESLRDALAKLRLNDAALTYEPESSDALGLGFRLGFLGLLHMDIIQERLEREYGLELIVSAPTVVYKVVDKSGEELAISNPCRLPAANKINHMLEPMVQASILAPQQAVGPILQLCSARRGTQKAMNFYGKQVQIEYELPMSEVVLDFFDQVKSLSSGYASLDYHFQRYQQSDLVRMDILINGERIDALACIVHRHNLRSQANKLTEKMRGLIPQQQFEVAIQAAVGAKIIARQTVRALRKNVTAKCYGGDITRKRKLLEKQKAGKKRMKRFGKVDVPQEAFLAALKA